MKYNEIGINVDSIDKLILDIYNYSEKIGTILDQITDVVDDTKEFYNCSAAYDYRTKFNDFKANFRIIKQNVNTYADDLIKLKNRYQGISQDITRDIKVATSKIQNNKLT